MELEGEEYNEVKGASRQAMMEKSTAAKDDSGAGKHFPEKKKK